MRLLATLILITILTGSASANVEIKLANSIVVDSEYMKLEDIAQLQGSGAERVGKVFLGPAPRSGASMKILRSDIIERLKGMGLYDQVDFVGSLGISVSRGGVSSGTTLTTRPNYSDVTRKSSSVEEKPKQQFGKKFTAYQEKAQEASALLVIKDAVKQYVVEHLDSNLNAVLSTTIRKFDIDGELGVKVTVEGVQRGELPGRCVLAVVCNDDVGNVCGYATVDVMVKLEVDVPVLARNLRRGNCVRKQDVVVKRLEYNTGMNIENINAAELDGRVALRSIRPGEPLSMAYFGETIDVRKGQMVTVCVVGNGFTIKEMALALADGSVGETVKVESVVSKSIYPVRVTGPNQADMPLSRL